ncbi:hypothetical protein HT031_000365 [Scenedesmus sp. PABB004]|nr:hypothetical protein HT031_000365 [Scenedesmus sp. PABB004]
MLLLVGGRRAPGPPLLAALHAAAGSHGAPGPGRAAADGSSGLGDGDRSAAACGARPPRRALSGSATTTTAGAPWRGPLVLPFLRDVLGSLSIPAAELDSLAAAGLSDAALAAWALARTASHPAAAEAAAAAATLRALVAKLDGGLAWRARSGSSPLGALLAGAAEGGAAQVLACRDDAELEGGAVLEYAVPAAAAAAAAAAARGAAPPTRAVLAEAVASVGLLTATHPLEAAAHPDFWALAAAAAARRPGLAGELALLGYGLEACAGAAAAQLAWVQGVLGLQASALRRALRGVAGLRGLSRGLFLPGREPDLAAAAGDAEAAALLGQLAAMHGLAAATGRSGVQLWGPPSAPELLARLTGVALPPPELGEALEQQLAAAAPALAALGAQLPLGALAQASSSGLLELMQAQPELQGLASALSAWRAEAGARGCLAVMASLSAAEVAALSAGQASRLGSQVMTLEARGRLLLRKAAARRLPLGSLEPEDVAALSWKAHTGGAAGAEELQRLLMAQASESYGAAAAELAAAESALVCMAAGFKLEEAASAASSAAPPSPLVLAGVPQHQVSELSKSLPSLTAPAGGAPAPAPGTATAEALVRDLAALLAPGGDGSGQAAAQRLTLLAHDLPRVLSGPLLDLLQTHQPCSLADAASAAAAQQRLLQALLAALEVELPRLVGGGSARADSASVWAAAGGGGGGDGAGGAAEGLLELLGEQDSADLLARRGSAVPGEAGLYEVLADIHHDGEVQRYLQMEFDAALELELVHAPPAWAAPEAARGGQAFLEGMRPLLDEYLAAQGEPRLADLEWQASRAAPRRAAAHSGRSAPARRTPAPPTVGAAPPCMQVYCDAALAEAEAAEAAAAPGGAARPGPGRSASEAAFLAARLEAGLPPGSVLAAAARKYLAAALRNRSWRFEQRQQLVDRLARPAVRQVEIAAHLAAHPPRSHRGSPFSPLFQPGGPPAAPRLSRRGVGGNLKLAAARGAAQ